MLVGDGPASMENWTYWQNLGGNTASELKLSKSPVPKGEPGTDVRAPLGAMLKPKIFSGRVAIAGRNGKGDRPRATAQQFGARLLTARSNIATKRQPPFLTNAPFRHLISNEDNKFNART